MVNLHEMFGKTIGVVYTFEGEDALGFTHYHVWADALQGMHGMCKKAQTEGINAMGDNSQPPQFKFKT